MAKMKLLRGTPDLPALRQLERQSLAAASVVKSA
jgi:hypothetical protein